MSATGIARNIVGVLLMYAAVVTAAVAQTDEQQGMPPAAVTTQPMDVQKQYDQAVQKAKERYRDTLAQCKGLQSEERDVCRQGAESELKSELAGAKARREAASAGIEAYEAQRSATYELQKEKCGTLRGDSRQVCMEGLRELFDKDAKTEAGAETK